MSVEPQAFIALLVSVIVVPILCGVVAHGVIVFHQRKREVSEPTLRVLRGALYRVRALSRGSGRVNWYGIELRIGTVLGRPTEENLQELRDFVWGANSVTHHRIGPLHVLHQIMNRLHDREYYRQGYGRNPTKPGGTSSRVRKL